MKILKNKRGNILINTLLTLTLSAITITGITRSVSQTGSMQEELLDRDLLVSFTDEVVEEYIPLVYEEFDRGLYKYKFYNQYGRSGDEFETILNDLMSDIDYSKYLNCTATYTDGWKEQRNYQMVCVPNNSPDEYIIDFIVTADGPKEKNREYFGNNGWHHVYTLKHEYYSQPIE